MQGQRLVHGLGRVAATLAMVLGLSALAFSAPVAAQDEVEIELSELNDSGVTGAAFLSETDDGLVEVSLELTGDAVTGDHPAHIHEGTCDDLDPNPIYPLLDVDADGLSENTGDDAVEADGGLAELTEGEYAINIHLSAEEIGVYIACGNLNAAVGGEDVSVEDEETADAPAEDASEEETTEAPAGDAAAVGGTTATTAPAAGVGSTVAQTGNGLLLAALAAFAVVLAAGGLKLRAGTARD
ncbi:MAG: hypothetical protein AVDCRST_MAG73-3263 [uncultured Thermomicrobiales bacterium]|uniref:CHRD domain-containing protein n=1 Tax=uncultured Thermomicrobiales bacterium TaxID=1645740 RepID=A0A6J4UNZ9_9BACT|nr:MAG: hypothetical protein AVDCRST_MAG73-3263 [uncultured Thermomicrobiales bacterium]